MNVNKQVVGQLLVVKSTEKNPYKCLLPLLCTLDGDRLLVYRIYYYYYYFSFANNIFFVDFVLFLFLSIFSSQNIHDSVLLVWHAVHSFCLNRFHYEHRNWNVHNSHRMANTAMTIRRTNPDDQLGLDKQNRMANTQANMQRKNSICVHVIFSFGVAGNTLDAYYCYMEIYRRTYHWCKNAIFFFLVNASN